MILGTSYITAQATVLSPYMKGTRVLDFGCGDLTLAASLHRVFSTLRITGVDVVDPGRSEAGVQFVRYDGVTLPFRSKSFDTTIAYHVFHHCSHPAVALSECARVTKKRILFVEPVVRSALEIPFMRLVDWVANSRRGEAIPMPYQFRTMEQWTDMVSRVGWRIENVVPAGVLPALLPIGRTWLFVAVPTNS